MNFLNEKSEKWLFIWHLEVMQMHDFCIDLACRHNGLADKFNDIGVFGNWAEAHSTVALAMHE
jgi:hypothetical protein